MLASALVIFKSVVNTCEAVGKACGRRAISDRDMRSERPGFERPAPHLPASLAGVVHSSQIGNLLD